MRVFTMVGGPYGGRLVPDPSGYFKEGDTEAIDSRSAMKPDMPWSEDSVYRVKGDQLVYDLAATLKYRREQKLS